MHPTIHTLDLQYLGAPGAIASYVLVGQEGPVMVETGPANTTQALARGLAGLGFAPDDVRHVLVTHIHFDHAGAAGWMARHGAHVYVHAFGRPHLIDPTRLIDSARRIYGERMEARWGRLEPIPEGQVTALSDLDLLTLEGIRIRVIDTPGHARHHLAFVLEEGVGRIAFTGDAAAAHVAEAPGFVSIPAPPPEFSLATWLASINRLDAERFLRIYPTHFGPVDDPPAHFARVRRALRAHAAFVRTMMVERLDRAEMDRRYTAWFTDQATRAGVPEEKIGFFVTDTMADMNLAGLRRYWRESGR